MPDQRLTTLEKNYSLMDQKLDQISADIKDLKENTISRHEMELANRKLVEEIFCKADGMFASKVTEMIVYGGAGAGLLYLINNLLEII